MDETELEKRPKNEPEHVPVHADIMNHHMAKRKRMWIAGIIAVLLVWLIAMVSFGLGYQLSRRATATRTGFFGGIGMMRGEYGNGAATGNFRTRPVARAGSAGTVTTVSGTSITINDTQRGGSVTYTIDSNTKVTQNGTTKTAADIKTGDTVRIVAAGADTSIATSIAIVTAV